MSLLPLKNIWLRRNFGIGIFLLTILLCALAVSFIPKKYSATSIVELSGNANTSNIQLFKNTEIEETSILRSHEILKNISDKLNLTLHEEFSIGHDKNRALITKLNDKIKLYFADENELNKTSQEKIIAQLNNELSVYLKNDFNIYITYTSHSPYVARTVANMVAKDYISIKNQTYSKKIIEKATFPHKISVPNIKKSVYSTLIIGLIMGIVAAMYITPKRKI